MLGAAVTMVAVSLLTKPDPDAGQTFYDALDRTTEEFYAIEE